MDRVEENEKVSLRDAIQEAKEEIYTRYGKKFGRLFRGFLREKESSVCQFCSEKNCPVVGRNLERAIHLICEEALPLAKKRGTDKTDRIFQLLTCCVAPIETVDSIVDTLDKLTSSKETATLMEHEIIRYTGKKLRQWRKQINGRMIEEVG